MSRTPVTQQPRPTTGESLEMKWVSKLSRGYTPGGVPSGLGILADTDHLRVQQTLDTLGVGCNTNNTYTLSNKAKEKIFEAEEYTSCCSRFWCGPARRFDMAIKNEEGEKILHFVRPVRCDACFCCCCLEKIMIQTPMGDVLGYVKQKWTFCGATLNVLNSEEELYYTIKSPACPCRCYTDLFFPIEDDQGEEVGMIRKQWGGKKLYANMDHENYVIEFPEDADIKMKAIILGGAFLVNYMYFEMT
ncbi:phospholipid scramblase 2-like [Saccoglossus kowalevskii]